MCCLIKYYCKNNAGIQSINDAGFEMDFKNPDLKIAGFKSGFGFEQFWDSGFGFGFGFEMLGGFGFDLDLRLLDLCPSLVSILAQLFNHLPLQLLSCWVALFS